MNSAAFRWAVAALVAALGLLVIWTLAAAVILGAAGYRGAADGHFHPLAWWIYASYYGWRQPLVARWLDISAAGAGVPILCIALALLVRLRGQGRPLYGEAHFAAERDLREAGFRAQPFEQALWVGLHRGKMLRLRGQDHAAIIAPTGAGKGVSYVITNAMMFPGSLVCLDLKGEVWIKTAGARRAAGQRVYRFDPLADGGATARWNPFTYVRRHGVDTFADVARIFEMLFPETDRSDFWTQAARLAATGVALFVSETPELPFTMGEVARIFTMAKPGAYIENKIRERQQAGGNYSSQAVSALSDFLRDPGGQSTKDVIKTVNARLQLWLDPRVDAATSESDFDLRDLRHKLFAIYVAVSRESLSLLRPVLALFFQQVVEVNSRLSFEDDPQARHRVLLLLDEFANLDRMKVLADGFSLVRGYGIRIMMVLQTRAQLPALYGDAAARAIMDNCGLKIFFRTDDPKELADLSERLGYNTVQSVSFNRPWLGFAGHGGQRRGETVSNQRRALRLPQEIARMGEGQVLVLLGAMPPLIARRIIYWKDKRFTRLIKDPPVVQPIPVTVRDAPILEPPASKQPRGRKDAPPPQHEPEPPLSDEVAPAVPPAKALLSDMLGRDFDLTKFRTDPASARAVVNEVIEKASATKRPRRKAGAPA